MERASVRLPLRVLADPQPWRLSKWVVPKGSSVYLNQRVALLKSESSGAVEHALAPHAGTLASILVSDGDIVDSSDTTIAQIEYCPHSIVFKGVCAVCGQDVETPHFAETRSRQESRLPVAYNSTLLSVTRAEAESVSSVTARRLFESRRLSLVLDLDHTLVHATDDPRAAAILQHSPPGVDLSSISSFSLGSSDSSVSSRMYLKLRPNLSQFLATVAPKFELHIYTMGSRLYADRVAKLIDPDSKFFSGRITSREDFAEGRFNRKNIERLFPCDDSMVLIVDDREDVWISGTDQDYMPNLVSADPYSFWGGMHEAYDRASGGKDVIPSATMPKPKLSQPPTPVVLHVNGNGEPLTKTAVLPRSGTCSSPSNARNAVGREGKPDQGLEDRLVGEGQEEQIKSSEYSNGKSIANDVREIEPCVEKALAQQSDLVEAANIDTSTVHTKKGQESQPQRSSGSLAASDVLVPDLTANETLPETQEISTGTVSFEEHLRSIVKGWWDSDVTLKSSQHLLRLAQVLEDCHTEFFRQASLACPGLPASTHRSNQKNYTFQAPADVKDVLAERRRKVLAGCVLTFTGVIPTGAKPETIPVWNLALRLGAVCSTEFVNGRTTHVVASAVRPANTQKCKEALHYGTAFVVTVNWLEDSALNFERQYELSYSQLAQRRFRSEVEYRMCVENRFKEAATKFKKRGRLELDDIAAKEVWHHQKRMRVEDSRDLSLEHSLDLESVLGHSMTARIVSEDELGAAMDSAFDD
eukprot:GFKZ01011607.1.p1 GENE.GFKZ01011607.1~~GFKZ01011607.1.p1  ORF type:complete len:756 (+),score=75.60 GFKZ01011607.1:150-2417(+)